MAKSTIFYTDQYKMIEELVATFLNSQPDYLSIRTAQSPRAAGDAIQEILAEHFQSLLGNLSVEYSAQFARRAMADLAFTDTDGCYYVVDVKTHRMGTKFNMPNLTSVERLARFYEDDKNDFVLLTIKYEILNTKVRVDKVHESWRGDTHRLVLWEESAKPPFT